MNLYQATLPIRNLLPKELRRSLLRRLFALKGNVGGDTSQYGEVTAIRRHIDSAFPRFIVDVGAYDGRVFSVSYPFVRQGWTAVLVEPHPAIFRLLTEAHARHARVKCVNKACSNHTGVLPLYVSADGEIGQEATLCTDDNELFNERRGAETIEVAVSTLTEILQEANAPREIGVLSIDAEGMNYEVLLGLDFDRFAPRIILTEDYPQNATKHLAKQKLLESQQYRLHTILGCNSLWLRPVP